MSDSVFIKRVVLKNYKSIAACSVELHPLNFLVGPNGAGKSNFLDALRLVAESLNTSLDHALRERGGIAEVRRRTRSSAGGKGRPRHFGVRLELHLGENQSGFYAFRVGAKARGGFVVQEEECRLYGAEVFDTTFYHVQTGQVVEASGKVMPPASEDRLYLVSASGLPEFRPVYDALSQMGFYNLNPEVIREPQPPSTGEVLRRDGSNLTSVLGLIADEENGHTRKRVIEFLSKVVPGVMNVVVKPVGKKETLEFHQRFDLTDSAWRFLAENMSDGTLRALGVLTALFQLVERGGRHIPLVGIEEPEAAVHPGAAGVLRDALKAASATSQVVVTSHSPDLLDDKDVSDEWILGVVNEHGETKIGPIDQADRSVLLDRLFTAGELLRQGQLTPDLGRLEQTPQKQYELFGREES